MSARLSEFRGGFPGACPERPRRRANDSRSPLRDLPAAAIPYVGRSRSRREILRLDHPPDVAAARETLCYTIYYYYHCTVTQARGRGPYEDAPGGRTVSRTPRVLSLAPRFGTRTTNERRATSAKTRP